MNYTPLHCHSHYSLLDGLSQPEDMVGRAEELGMDAIAMTDHGSVSGTVEMLKQSKDKVKPILGIEAYVCDMDASVKNTDNKKLSHLVLLAKNDAGWKSLLKIVSESNQKAHFYHKPRLHLEQIAPLVDGNIFAISGHLGSTIARTVMNNPSWENEGIRLAELHEEIFGKGNFFLEVQLIDKDTIDEMVECTDKVRSIGRKTGIPVVATPDAHYCRKEDAYDQRIVLCKNLGGLTLAQARKKVDMPFFKSNNFHIPSFDEMQACGHTMEELDNTNLIASQCKGYSDILHPPMLPPFACPGDHNPDTWLRQLCRDGWRQKIADRVPKDKHQEYADRVKHELSVLQGAGLSSYFLMVKDIVDFVTDNGWLPGPGRGSAAGCLVSYLLGITGIDPLPYDLIFERFYNAGRNTDTHISMPDIDVDVPSGKRDEIIDYIKKEYGEDKVGQMISFQTMKGRAAIKDVLRAYGGISNDEMDMITSRFPEEPKIAGELQEMEKETGESSSVLYTLLHDDEGRLKDWCYIEDGEFRGPLAKRFEQACRLEGTKTAQSKHAAGIVVAPVALEEFCPIVYDTKTKSRVAAWEMNDLEAGGGLKLDILGLSMLDKAMGSADILEDGDVRL